MVSHLERQLQLEKIDVGNKVKGFEQTQKKYSEIWNSYEVLNNFLFSNSE